jgi:hypothetical protein
MQALKHLKKLATMNQHPDKLFRDKLEHLHKSVPSSSWLKVESQLANKSRKPFWLKIAAALIFLLAASAILLIDKNSNQQHTAVNQSLNKNPQPAKKNDSPVAAVDSIKMPEAEEIKISGERRDKKTQVPRKKSNTENKKESIEIDQEHYAQQEIDEVNLPEIVDATEVKEIVEESSIATSVQSGKTNVHEESTITLIYNAEEVDDKYLNKKALTEATPENKKPSTLKKLLDKAYDLKHNQDAFGELRQKKNEILALNFKSDKQRSQNR